MLSCRYCEPRQETADYKLVTKDNKTVEIISLIVFH